VGESAVGIIAQVEGFVAPLLADMELELVDIEFRREGHGWVLRLYIDRPGGVTLDDCARVSREVGSYLEVEDPVDHSYHLEVSSPGLERPLKKENDFIRFSGRLARVKLRHKRNGQRVFIGMLQGVEEGDVLLEIDGGIERLPLEDIARARLVLEKGNFGNRNRTKTNE